MLLVDLQFVIVEYLCATQALVLALNLELRKHVSDYLVRFQLEVGLLSALEGTLA